MCYTADIIEYSDITQIGNIREQEDFENSDMNLLIDSYYAYYENQKYKNIDELNNNTLDSSLEKTYIEPDRISAQAFADFVAHTREVQSNGGILLEAETPINNVSEAGSKADESENAAVSFCKKVGFKLDKCAFSKDELEQVCELILEFEDVVSQGDMDLGHCKLLNPKIKLKHDNPIFVKPRPIPHNKREAFERQMKLLLEKDIIEPSHSPYNFPILLVDKPLKENCLPDVRLTIDYRLLNDITVKTRYPLPKISEILDKLAGSRYLSSFDLAHGFFQIALHKDSRAYTSFSCYLGSFQFKRLAQGHCCSPALFQATVDRVLCDLNHSQIYVDDLIVGTRDFVSHLLELRQVFERFRKYKLKIKPGKSELGRTEVTYLGFLISNTGIKPAPKKQKVIESWAPPKDPDDIIRFLALCSFYRGFVPKFSELEFPLRQLTLKEAREKPFVLTEEARAAFETLKSKLLSPPLLAYPDLNKPFLIMSDASHVGVASLLLQHDDEMRAHPIKYTAKSLSTAARNYAIIDLEALSIVHALTDAFRSYVYGARWPVKIYTDHKPLIRMTYAKESTRLFKYAQMISNYNYEIYYKKGIENLDADALSRQAPFLDTDGELDEELLFSHAFPLTVNAVETRAQTAQKEIEQAKINDEDKNFEINQEIDSQFKIEQKKDNTLRRYINIIKEGDKQKLCLVPTGYYLDKQGFLRFQREHVSRYDIFGAAYVVPDRLKNMILESSHDHITSGHLGFEKTLDKLYTKFHWPNMRQDVRNHIDACGMCNSRNRPNQAFKQPLQPLAIPEKFARISMDILGGLPLTENGNKYILVLVENSTRFPLAFALPNCETETIAKCLLENYIYIFSAPKFILSDNAAYNISKLAMKVNEILGMEAVTIAVGNSKCNGLAERQNSTILNCISKFCSENGSDWDEVLPPLMYAIRTTKQASLKYSSFYLMFGEIPNNPFENCLGLPETKTYKDHDDFAIKLEHNLERAFSIASKYLEEAQIRQKQNYDARLKNRHIIKGDLCRIYDDTAIRNRPNKLQLPYKGPYLVIEIDKFNAKLVHIKDTKNIPLIRNFDLLKITNSEKSKFTEDELSVEKRSENLGVNEDIPIRDPRELKHLDFKKRLSV